MPQIQQWVASWKWCELELLTHAPALNVEKSIDLHTPWELIWKTNILFARDTDVSYVERWLNLATPYIHTCQDNIEESQLRIFLFCQCLLPLTPNWPASFSLRSPQVNLLLALPLRLPVEVIYLNWIIASPFITRTSSPFPPLSLQPTSTFQITETEIERGITTRITITMIQKIWESPCLPQCLPQTFPHLIIPHKPTPSTLWRLTEWNPQIPALEEVQPFLTPTYQW